MFPMQKMFLQFMNNPQQFMSQCGLDVTQEDLQNPDSFIQKLMNSGKMSQQQYNNIVKTSNQLRNNSHFMQFLNRFIPH
jgi:ferritin